jgi:adenylate cyclase class 2
MAFEIELKAWLDDRETTERNIEAAAAFIADFEKSDTYWQPASVGVAGAEMPPSGVRVRRELVRQAGRDAAAPRVLVTYKTKEVRDGIEINEEKEFAVTGADEKADGTEPLEELFSRLGLAKSAVKTKRGRLWRYGEIGVEVSEVGGLGVFVELEIIAPDGSGPTVEAARRKLLDFIRLIGISKEKIESRYYNELLRERRL